MKINILFITIFTLAFTNQVKSQDSTALVSAFFGLDNAMPLQANFLCSGALGMDGMPVNFKYPLMQVVYQHLILKLWIALEIYTYLFVPF